MAEFDAVARQCVVAVKSFPVATVAGMYSNHRRLAADLDSRSRSSCRRRRWHPHSSDRCVAYCSAVAQASVIADLAQPSVGAAADRATADCFRRAAVEIVH